MKKLLVFPAVIAIAALVSCQKQQTEAEKNAEVERQVQERLAAEHQAEQQQQLQQRQTDLDTREKALADKESAAAATPARRERPESEPVTRPRAVSGSRPASGYSTFYTKLEPHGAWLETGDYGYVWQPREAESSQNWRPYTNGRWVYTDAGWTWISQEPFGWATYHYGRWTRLRGIGWVWVPGNEWAPAWVSWRKSNEYVGWAPLPPEARFDQRTGIHNWSDNYYDIGPDQYCFVASREFGAQRIESNILPPERNVTIVNQTTNVTNITYNNTTIVNEGPNYDELRAQSREPVQRFRLQRNVNVDIAAEPPLSFVQGETVVIAAPVIAAPAASERPPRVKQTVAQVTVDLGWAAIGDHEAAKKAREKMKSEAAPPSNAPPKKFVKTAATTTTASQGSETPGSSPSATISATQAPTAAATSTSEPKMTPPGVAPSEQSPTPAATLTPTSSASALPTASQRRGRLLVPSATPTPRTTPKSASTSPAATDTISPTAIPAPSPSATSTAGASQPEMTRGKFKSQAQKFSPRKIEPMRSPSATVTSTAAPSVAASPTAIGVEPEAAAPGKFKSEERDSHHRKVPMAPAASATPAPTASMRATASSAASVSPDENLTKKEKREQKREEKKELKRERREAAQQGEVASPSPSATPSPGSSR